jgi:hypothetical protein
VNLYVGKTAVKFNIPEAEAVDRLKDLIREHGKWVDPVSQATAVETFPALVIAAHPDGRIIDCRFCSPAASPRRNENRK